MAVPGIWSLAVVSQNQTQAPLGTLLLLIGAIIAVVAAFLAVSFAWFRFQSRNWGVMTPSDTFADSQRKLAMYRAYRIRSVGVAFKLVGGAGMVVLLVGAIMKLVS